MNDFLMIALFGGFCQAYLCWGIRLLPAERWQIAATVPVAKIGDQWRGLNLTWYGILTANAYVVAAMVLLTLLAAVRLPILPSLAMLSLILLICVPSSRLVAGLVEKKANTFTVGGAVFVGTLIAPWLALLGSSFVRKQTGLSVPAPAILSAIAIAYAFGEGLGRLACLSFGCCYGKPLASSSPLLKKFLGPFCTVFQGPIKKAAYASGLNGVQLLPVQGITAILYTLTGLVGILLFRTGWYATAFLLALTVTQLWRVISEFMRDDFRGGGKISAYQIMGLVGTLYSWIMLPFLVEKGAALPDLATGVAILWAPGPLLSLQFLWGIIFLYTGRSRVTGSMMSFHVEHRKT